jgi:hypothetical protein
MSFAIGMSWLHHKHLYQQRFAQPVPEWVCCYPTLQRIRLLKIGIAVGWPLPQAILVQDELLF